MTRDPLDKPTGEVTNTMDKDYPMLRLDEPALHEVTNTMDTDYGLVSTADRLWWAGAVTSRFAGFCSSQPSGYTWDFPFSSSFVLSNFEVRGRVSLSIRQSSLFLYPTGSW